MLTRNNCLCPFHEHGFYNSRHLCWGGAVIGNKLFTGKELKPKIALDTQHPEDWCTWNFVNQEYIYDANQITTSQYSYAKQVTPRLKKDVQYASENDPSCNASGADCNSLDFQGENPLRYIAYYPIKPIADYNARPLPLVVLIHGGGNSDCSAIGGDTQTDTVARSLAIKAFIVISVEYRRGRILDLTAVPQNGMQNYPQGYTSAQQELAAYRGQQDGRGALKTILQRNANGHSNLFKFNTSQVFVGGFSAGAGIANGLTYYPDQTTIDAVFPSKNGKRSISNALGPIDTDYYAAPPTAPMPVIAGCLNCWGGLGIPRSFETNIPNFLVPPSLPPMIAFQGTKDQVVWFNNIHKQRVFYSMPGGSPECSKENSCLEDTEGDPYFYVKSNNLESASVTTILCTLDLYCYLQSQNIYSELYLDPDMLHGLDCDATVPGCNNPSAFKSDFGTGYTTRDAVWRYIAIRAACFFQAIMNGLTNSGATGDSEFVDCKNSRGGCSTASNHPNCPVPSSLQCN